MPITLRGMTWQVSLSKNGKRIRRGGFTSQADAMRWEASVLEGIEDGTVRIHEPASTEQWTMARLLDTVALKYWAGTANEDNAVRNAEACVKFLGENTDPRDVTTDKVDALVHHLTTCGNSAATVNRKLAALSKLMKFALGRGIITRKPLIERKRESAGRLRWYTREEEERILAAAGTPEMHDLLLFLFDTGCRLSEALKLRWTDVDDVYARLHETKGGGSRAVPITGRGRSMLKSKDRSSELVFGGVDRFAVHKSWERIRKAAEITGDDAVIHTIRHTCASRLVQAGVGIQVVQQWLGHKSLTMTLRYAHLAPHNILHAVSVLESGYQQERKVKLA